jgi:hypothetical protein
MPNILNELLFMSGDLVRMNPEIWLSPYISRKDCRGNSVGRLGEGRSDGGVWERGGQGIIGLLEAWAGSGPVYEFSKFLAYYVGLPLTDSASNLRSRPETHWRIILTNYHGTDITAKGRRVGQDGVR